MAFNPGRHGVGGRADLTLSSLAALIRSPFQGRVDSLAALGVAAALGSVCLLLAQGRRLSARWRLVVAIAVGEPAVLLLLSALGARVGLTRYATVAVPFAIVAIAGGVARLPRWSAMAAGAGVLAVAIVGTIANHQPGSFYPDTRGAVVYIQRHQRPGDVLVSPRSPSLAVPLAYYGRTRLRPPLPYAFAGSPSAAAIISMRRRLWVVEQIPRAPAPPRALLAAARPLARRLGYGAVAARAFPSATPLAVVLFAPLQR